MSVSVFISRVHAPLQSLVISAVTNYCINDLSGFYLDVLKDRLYTHPLHSPIRQNTQRTLLHILDALNFAINPVMPTLAQEVYTHYRSHLATEDGETVLPLMGERMWNTEQRVSNDETLQLYHAIRSLRLAYMDWFNTELKPQLQLKSVLQCDLVIDTTLPLSASDLQEIFQAARVTKQCLADDGVTGTRRRFDHNNTTISATVSMRAKCPRCWTHNSHAESEACPRCTSQLQDAHATHSAQIAPLTTRIPE